MGRGARHHPSWSAEPAGETVIDHDTYLTALELGQRIDAWRQGVQGDLFRLAMRQFAVTFEQCEDALHALRGRAEWAVWRLRRDSADAPLLVTYLTDGRRGFCTTQATARSGLMEQYCWIVPTDGPEVFVHGEQIISAQRLPAAP